MLILGLRVLFAIFDLPTALIDIAHGSHHRAGAGALRACMPCRVSLGPEQLDPHLGTQLTFVLWAIISFQVLGWFAGIERTLDSIDLMPGKASSASGRCSRASWSSSAS